MAEAELAEAFRAVRKNTLVIAEEIGVSRVKVYRLLKEAREEQIVKIVIDWHLHDRERVVLGESSIRGI